MTPGSRSPGQTGRRTLFSPQFVPFTRLIRLSLSSTAPPLREGQPVQPRPLADLQLSEALHQDRLL